MKSNVFVGLKPGNRSQDPGGPGLASNYDYLLRPLTNTRYRDSVKRYYQEYKAQNNPAALNVPPPQLQELTVPPFSAKKDGDAINQYIGLISSWLELESSDISVRELSYEVLLHEWQYAKFIGIKQLILAPPRNLNNLHQYAQMISRVLSLETKDDESLSTPILSISLPLFEDTDPLSTWELWNTIRKLCGYHPSLTISLALPRYKTPTHVLQRWLAEPVTCLLVSSSIFATNQYNYPVLNKFNQNIIAEFQRINGNSQPKLGELCVILHGMEKYSTLVRGGEPAYLEYVNYLLKKGDKAIMAEVSSVSETDQAPRIMPPLKPLSDNLSNYTYHVFEKDKVKYDLYESAIFQALQDLLKETKQKWLAKDSNLVILVTGAGRGPLVDKTFKCLQRLKIVGSHLIALEKNPQAMLYLQKRNFDCWNNSVEIINQDMRSWPSQTKVDLCISELLGSFGCNELSPECLWNIETYHSKPTTKFIPQKYTSYVAPVSSPLLYQKLKSMGPNALESPWVIHKIPYCMLSSKINELWSFEHPNSSKFDPFTKVTTTQFKVKHKGEMHGLVGFFTATLYSNITLSILPDESTVKLKTDREFNDQPLEEKRSSGLYQKVNHTSEMNSWSPIFFPLKQPFFISDDTEVEVFMARNHTLDSDRVWYEWSVGSFVYLVVGEHNNNGSVALRAESIKTQPQPLHHTPLNNQRTRSIDNNLPSEVGIQRAFGHFEPSPNVLAQHVDEDEDGSDLFNSTNSESGFMVQQDNVWQSVHDVHELAIPDTPLFDLHAGVLDEGHEEQSTFEEYHVRVKTGVSELHNMGGKFHRIPLK